MRFVIVTALIAALVPSVLAQQNTAGDRALIAQAASERDSSAGATPASTPAGGDVSASDGDLSERAARIDVTLSQVRLELVLARQALRADDHLDYANRAQRVLDLLEQLPPNVDASEYALQAEGLLARAKARGFEAERHAQPKRRHTDASSFRYRESVRDEIDRQIEEMSAVPQDDITYPADWVEKTRHRAKYRGGQIARSKSWTDEAGREWYTAVYDIHDLILVPPDFRPTLTLDPATDLMVMQDRHALRWQSGIFNSYDARTLAAGIPLLRYFGGVDPLGDMGYYDLDRQQQIIEMIQAFTEQPPNSSIVPLTQS